MDAAAGEMVTKGSIHDFESGGIVVPESSAATVCLPRRGEAFSRLLLGLSRGTPGPKMAR
jgi:hypothetical protein